MEQFTYKDHPLSDASSQIRLLKLDTLCSEWIMVSPVHFRSDNGRSSFVDDEGQPIQFAAVSYEWGEPDDDEIIDIGGRSRRIRENLSQFLQAIIDYAKETLWQPEKYPPLPEYFWIDSICIDQKLHSEKSVQIRLLKNVFESAECVISWLRSEPHDKAMNHLWKSNKGEYADGAKGDLHELLNATYWTRIWMVQEIVLARRWEIMCGNRVVHGEDLSKFLTEYSKGSSGLEFRYSKAYNYVQERKRFRKNQPSSLLSLLCGFMYLHSTYPVDKIRALLALCSHDTQNLNELLRQFEITENDSEEYSECKDKICAEMVNLAREGDVLSPQSEDIYRKLVAGVLGDNLSYLAEKLKASISTTLEYYDSGPQSAPSRIRSKNRRSPVNRPRRTQTMDDHL